MKVIYIAGPFRGANAWHVAENIRAAERLAFDIAHMGAMPLCPHSATAHFDGTMTDAFWLAGTQELLRRCDAIACVDNWAESVGARAEVNLAGALCIPVLFDVASIRQFCEARSCAGCALEPEHGNGGCDWPGERCDQYHEAE
uniref:Nucleoside 2-deoxyribosyltransferase n=1 Tax=viral metagenome TaxID=1070528 RepID=A0A6H2A5N6_9ZZZZ